MKTKMSLKWAIPMMAISAQVMMGCGNSEPAKTETEMTTDYDGEDPNFEVKAQAFADLQLLRYQVPKFNTLSLQQKKLAYYLYQAALCGRDIIYDQKSKDGIMLRKTIETIFGTYKGDKTTPEWEQFKTYCGRVWFSNGNYHHYSNEKFIPECSYEYFTTIAKESDVDALPKEEGESVDDFLGRIKPTVYDINYKSKLVDQRPNVDNIVGSANNFYEGVTQKEVEAYYAKFDTKGHAPSWGLNSKVVKENGQVVEKTWKIGGMYGASLEKIAGWLEKAATVAEDSLQKASLELLVKYYKTGDLKTFDDYSIAWANNTEPRIDAVNGFIEVYMDAIGKKASFESTVSLRDNEGTKMIKTIASEAQWFEDNSPIMDEHKKKVVKGIDGKAITVIVESGDAAPSTPIGINLPNADWIRAEYGSKSVSLSNIVHSYNMVKVTSGVGKEFVVNDQILERLKKYGDLASNLHTDMHECIGHASGKINEGVETTDKTLKNYASCLEEARADLVGLYYVYDQKLVDLGVMPSLEVGKAGYDNYITNGMITQLTRLKAGEQLEEAHMRNRALIAHWAYEKGKKDSVIEMITKDGKTYVQVNNYDKLKVLFGELLREIQRIKSEGDYEAGKNLVETYGVKVDPKLHAEILERYAKLNTKPYSGFIQPKLIPVMNGGDITDVKVEYPDNFFNQMMEYGKEYAFLPIHN